MENRRIAAKAIAAIYAAAADQSHRKPDHDKVLEGLRHEAKLILEAERGRERIYSQRIRSALSSRLLSGPLPTYTSQHIRWANSITAALDKLEAEHPAPAKSSPTGKRERAKRIIAKLRDEYPEILGRFRDPPPLPFIQRWIDKGGVEHVYFRKPGHPRVPLPKWDSREFLEAYRRAAGIENEPLLAAAA